MLAIMCHHTSPPRLKPLGCTKRTSLEYHICLLKSQSSFKSCIWGINSLYKEWEEKIDRFGHWLSGHIFLSSKYKLTKNVSELNWTEQWLWWSNHIMLLQKSYNSWKIFVPPGQKRAKGDWWWVPKLMWWRHWSRGTSFSLWREWRCLRCFPDSSQKGYA